MPGPTHWLSKDWPWILGLTVLAWLHRVAFLLSNRDRTWPFSIFYQGDTRVFYDYAFSILRGVEYDSGLPFHPPGFAYFLALVYTLTGADPATGSVPHLAVRLILAAVSSASVGLLFALVRPYLGFTAALLAALLCLYHFGLYVIAVSSVSEGLYLTFLLTILLIWSRKLRHPLQAPGSKPALGTEAALSGLALGLLLGVLALTRAEGVLIAVLCVGAGLVGWWRDREFEAGRRLARLAPWVFLVAGWLLAVAPWTVHNHLNLRAINLELSGRTDAPLPTFVPITLYGPINLALANHEEADGVFSREVMFSQSHTGILDLRDPQHLDFMINGGARAWRFVREQPGRFARLVARKWALASEAVNLGWTQWNLPGGLNGTRRPVDIFVPDGGARSVVLALVFVGSLIGLRSGGGPRRWTLLVLVITAATMGTTGLFFGYARHWLLLMPFWFATIAYVVVWIAVWTLRRTFGRESSEQPSYAAPARVVLSFLALLVITMLGLEGSRVNAARNYVASGTNLPGRATIDPDQPVTIRVLP